MGNEESMMAEGGAPQANGVPGGPRPGGPGQTQGAPNPLGNIGLGNLSNLGSSITNTIKNQANQAASSGGGLSNLANIGSSITSQAKSLASNLDTIKSNITSDLTGAPSGSNLNRTATSGGMQQRPPQQPQKAKPDVPDVDMTGLTEEERAMIQSVMMRAKESDTTAQPPSSQSSQMPTQQQQMQQMQQPKPTDSMMGTNMMGTNMMQQRQQDEMKSQQR